MSDVEEIIEKVALVKDGFKPIRDLADDALTRHSDDEALALAHALYRSEVHQARMLATMTRYLHEKLPPIKNGTTE